MFKQTVNISKTLRFKRWSRKRYAAFASLNKVVSIASLAVSVADKSLIKVGNYLQSCAHALSNDDLLSESTNFDELENLLALNAENQQIITIQTSADACAAGTSTVYSLLKATNKGNEPIVGRFFVCGNLQIFKYQIFKNQIFEYQVIKFQIKFK